MTNKRQTLCIFIFPYLSAGPHRDHFSKAINSNFLPNDAMICFNYAEINIIVLKFMFKTIHFHHCTQGESFVIMGVGVVGVWVS